MSTKNNPGAYDCWAAALPDEPYFLLLARDKVAPLVVRAWCSERISKELNVLADPQIDEARGCANAMEKWHQEHRMKTLKVVWADAALDRALATLSRLHVDEGDQRVIEAIQVGIDAIRTVRGEQ